MLNFVEDTNKKNREYFPMFVMGKGVHSFMRKLGLSMSIFRNMYDYRNQNLQVELLKDYNDTFILHPLQFDRSNAESFTLGKFFNKQHTGFRIRDLNLDEKLKQWITPIATFKGTGDAHENIKVDGVEKNDYNKDYEFIAIAEGIHLPIYLFTYNIEMTQFVYTDMYKNPDQEECIDKSLLSRHHAQFISSQIADEARLNNHKRDIEDHDFKRLIKNHKVISLENQKDSDSRSHGFNPMPQGLEEHDVYLINHHVQQAHEEVPVEAVED